MNAGGKLLSILMIIELNPSEVRTQRVEQGAIYKKQLSTYGNRRVLSEEWKDDRIVGGEVVDPGEFPFVVSLKYSANKHFCGGSLFTLSHIVSACHCLSDSWSSYEGIPKLKSASSITVHAGSMQREGREGQKQTAKKVLVSPFCRKNSSGLHYDVGVLITSPFELVKAVVEPTKLPDYPPRTELERTLTSGANVECYVVGWGAVAEKGPFSDDLLEVQLNIQPQRVCRNEIDAFAMLLGSSNRYDGESGICAFGGVKKDACQGDSGSPLICKIAGSTTVYAVVSWGFGCGRSVPAVYGRLDVVKPWLEEAFLDDRAALSSKCVTLTNTVLLLHMNQLL